MDRLSFASLSNPGMTPDDTPLTQFTSTFDQHSPRVPPSLDEDQIIEHLDETLSLTSADIRSDPILLALHKKQSRPHLNPITKPSSSTTFRAKPAPKIVDGAGPRMTKAAALRQGLKWDPPKPEKKEDVPAEKKAGQKRMSILTV